MAKAIIHIGMHKTGSSSIQATLASLPPGRGPKIVQIGGTPNLSGLLKRGFNSKLKPGRLRGLTSDTFDVKRAAAKEKMRQALEPLSREDIVISAEGFTGLAAVDFAEFLTLLPGHVVEVVGYVRAPRSMMSSAFQQRLRIGLGRLNPSALMPAYKSVLEKFELAPSLTLRLFDRKSLVNGDVVQDFCQHVGIRVDPDEIINKNEGLSLEAGRLLFSFNRWRERVGLPIPRGFILTGVLSELEGDKLYLASEILDPVIAAHRESITWVENKLSATFDHDTAEGGVRSDADMLDVSDDATRWLARQVREDWKGRPSEEKVGMWMQLLYEKVPVAAFKRERRATGAGDDEDGLDGDA